MVETKEIYGGYFSNFLHMECALVQNINILFICFFNLQRFDFGRVVSHGFTDSFCTSIPDVPEPEVVWIGLYM